MLKKKLHTALSILICCSAAIGTRAQIAVTIPASNITGQLDYTLNAAPSGTAATLGIGGTIKVSSTTANLPAVTSGTSLPLPLSVVYIKAVAIGGISLLGGSTEVNLTQNPINTYAALVALGSGPFTADYRIAIAGNAWLAGTYSTPVAFTNVTPPTQTLSITVPGLITLNTVVSNPTTMTINALSAFRTGGGISATNSFNYYATVPTDITLKSTGSTFSFSTTQLFNSTPVVASSQLSSLLDGPYAGSAVNLSTTDQPISAAASVPVTVTNKNAFTNTFSISPASLKSSFVQAGTYTLPTVYTIAKKSTAYPLTLTSGTMNTSVQVTVIKMSELIIPPSTVNLSFNSAAAYSQGLTAVMSNPVTVSSTVPYNITVRTSGNFISGSNSIPAGVVTVEGIPSQTGITPVQLSTTATALLTGANPQIDRVVNLQFRVPASQTSNLLNKPAGTYNATVTFTIVAP